MFVVSMPCGLIAGLLAWMALFEPGWILSEEVLYGGQPVSLLENLFTRGFLLFMALVFAVPQLGAARRLLGSDRFLPPLVSRVLGGAMALSGTLGSVAVALRGSWESLGGTLSLMFLGFLFFRIAAPSETTQAADS